MAGEFVCPWWIGYVLVCPARRWLNDPAKLLAPYLREGMTVLEPGPGMGFFTLELARLAGPSGRVIAVDIQPKMVAGLRRRAGKAGLAERIDARLARPGSLGLAGLENTVDFALAFAVVHEFPDAGPFFAEVAPALKPGGALLFAEPSGHVTQPQFEAELAAAAAAGFLLETRPAIRRNHAALLRKV
ncbi:MAG: class I SAM-dependent methyltransferase [Acidobacteriia bacterium]|nr:class I SAM-dependent methyltransferase [Terriglobia bacterium]